MAPSHVRCTGCTVFSSTFVFTSSVRCNCCSIGSSTFALCVVIVTISPASTASFLVLHCTGHWQNVCDWTSSWFLDFRHRNLPSTGGSAERLACSPPLDTMRWNLMWLAAWGRLVLLFVQSVLLMVLRVSFEARSPRLLSGNGSAHFSTHLVPQVRPVVQLVHHAPDAMESLSYSRALEPGVLHLATFVAHLSPENIRSESRSRGCHLPPNHTPYLHLDRSFNM